VAVLGRMAELGRDGAAAHRRIGELATSMAIEVVSVGAPEYGVEELGTAAAALDRLADLGDGDVVLVKGSRLEGLDALAAELRGGAR